MSKPKKVSRNLYIGLGGTGYKILFQVKKSLYKHYGEVPPSIKFLALDTDVAPLKSQKEEISFEDPRTGKIKKKMLSFENTELMPIPVKNPDRLLKFDHIQDWLSDKIAPMISPGDDGARQIRSLGRFAFFENFSREKIDFKIESLLGELKDGELERDLDYEMLGDPQIHLVFSPCGGTGAGIFMDIAMIIKTNPKFENIPIYAWMVMPDFYSKFPMTENVNKNTYAALMEIDHLMGKDRTPEKPWSNYDVSKPFTTNYNGNLKLELGAAKFFDYIYLFDNTTMSGRQINEIDDIYDRIGRTLYQMASGAGHEMLSMYSNNTDYHHISSKETGSKRRNYSSIGLSQIILNRDYLRNLKMTRATKVILNSFLHLPETIDEEEFDNFIDTNQLREDRNQDQVIDKIFPKNELRFSRESILPSEYKKDTHLEVAENATLQLNNIESAIKIRGTKVVYELIKSFQNALDNKIELDFDSPGGIIKVKQFLNYLFGSFEGMKNEMIAEQKEHTSLITSIKKSLPTYKDTIIEKENSFKLFGKSANIKESCNDYIKTYERLIFTTFENIRKDYAEQFYLKALAIIDNQINENNKLDNLLSETSRDRQKRIQSLINEEQNECDFEQYIHHFANDLMEVNPEDVNIQEAFNKIKFNKLRRVNSSQEVIDLIEQYLKDTTLIKNISELSIEQILEKLPQNIFSKIISYLDSQSDACINLDVTSFLHGSSKPTMENFGFISVPDIDKTIFTADSEAVSHLSNSNGFIFGRTLKTVETGDPDRISMIKIVGMFPACAVNKIKTLKADHELSKAHGGYHFSDVYFEKNALDLIEGPKFDDNIIETFAIGSALNKIILDRGGIYFIGNNNRREPLFHGTRNKTNRSEAYKVFSKDDKIQKEINSFYERFLDKHGKPELIKRFRHHYMNLDKVEILGKRLENIDKESDEYDHVFKEREAILRATEKNGIDTKPWEEEIFNNN